MRSIERRWLDTGSGQGEVVDVLVMHAPLTPVDEAYAAYVSHAVVCHDCHAIDGPCRIGDTLWASYKAKVDGEAS